MDADDEYYYKINILTCCTVSSIQIYSLSTNHYNTIQYNEAGSLPDDIRISGIPPELPVIVL